MFSILFSMTAVGVLVPDLAFAAGLFSSSVDVYSGSSSNRNYTVDRKGMTWDDTV